MNEFEIDKRQVRRAFSRAARLRCGRGIAARSVHAHAGAAGLRQAAAAAHAGCRAAARAGARASWASAIPKAEITALDIAIGMLQVARGTSGWWQKLFGGAQQIQLCADVEALPLAPNSVGMVWSNLALQWCNDLPATFVELHRVLKVDGLLMFCTFGVGYAAGVAAGVQRCGRLQPSQPFRRHARHRRHAGGQPDSPIR